MSSLCPLRSIPLSVYQIYVGKLPSTDSKPRSWRPFSDDPRVSLSPSVLYTVNHVLRRFGIIMSISQCIIPSRCATSSLSRSLVPVWLNCRGLGSLTAVCPCLALAQNTTFIMCRSAWLTSRLLDVVTPCQLDNLNLKGNLSSLDQGVCTVPYQIWLGGGGLNNFQLLFKVPVRNCPPYP